MKWGGDGWPTINGGRGPSARADAPTGVRARASDAHRFFDDFTTASLNPGWQWPAANEPSVSVEARRRGWLALAPAAGQAESPLGGVVARSTTTGDYEATTEVETRTLAGGMAAGLAAFGDMENALGLSVGGGKVMLWRRERKGERTEQATVASVDAPAGATLFLRMRAREGHHYRFAVSRDGRAWQDVGEEVDGSYLPPWDRGVRVALTAGGARGGGAARFGFLRVTPSR